MKKGQAPTEAALQLYAAKPPPADGWRRTKDFDSITFNRGAEAAFVTFALAHEGLSVAELLREASFELDVSPETAKRYLFKHTASRAELTIVDGHVVANHALHSGEKRRLKASREGERSEP